MPQNPNRKPRQPKKAVRQRIIEHLSEPENDWTPWSQLSVGACGYADERELFRVFTAQERREIEAEAMALRRQHFAGILAKIDNALINKALCGDVQAIKLAYQKFEGWSEKQQIEFPDADGKPQSITGRQILEREFGIDTKKVRH